jgi:putative phosphoesterase
MLSARKRLTLNFGRIGLISDTHGLIRPEALAALRGSELIIHAGDIGKPEVLAALEDVAPTLAIRGNNDREPWAKTIPDLLQLKINGMGICVIHNVNEWVRDSAGELRAVISGHSHKPNVRTSDGVMFVNPGSAGPRRFKLPIAVGRLQITRRNVHGKIILLA